MKAKQLEKCIQNLGVRRSISFEGSVFKLACLVRDEDRRPFQAPWYKGKQSYLVAVDDDGNFYLRHSGGYIFRASPNSSEQLTIAKSEEEFLSMLDWDEMD
jgi:hypothetical protein